MFIIYRMCVIVVAWNCWVMALVMEGNNKSTSWHQRSLIFKGNDGLLH